MKRASNRDRCDLAVFPKPVLAPAGACGREVSIIDGAVAEMILRVLQPLRAGGEDGGRGVRRRQPRLGLALLPRVPSIVEVANTR